MFTWWGTALVHSCTPHKHQHELEKERWPSKLSFFLHSCFTGQQWWPGPVRFLTVFMLSKVCLEVQTYRKDVILYYIPTRNRCKNTKWKHMSQISSGLTWCHSHLLSHLIQMWRFIKHWKVISINNPDLVLHNMFRCLSAHVHAALKSVFKSSS